MTVDQGVLDTGSNAALIGIYQSNSKSTQEGNDFKSELAGLRVQMARTSADSYARLALLGEKAMASAISSWDEAKIKEAIAVDKYLKSSAESSILADVSQSSAGQETAKVAQSTPGAEANITTVLAQLSAGMAAILGALQSGQIGTKTAQSTPPETAVPGTVIAGK